MIAKVTTALALIFTLQLSAQNIWPHEDAEWWLDFNSSLFSPGEYHHYVNGDSLINGIICSAIRTDHLFAFPNDPENVLTDFLREEYLYFNGDTVFWWKENQFYPLLCFNAEVGDSWYPLPLDFLGEDCDSIPVFVISKDSVNYSGNWYRRISIQSEPGQNSPFYWEGSFDERTFGRTHFYPEYNTCNSIVEWPSLSFRCYRDELFTINESNFPCGSLLLSNGETSYTEEPQIYPNPISRGEFLNIGGVKIISLVALTGERVALANEPNASRVKVDVSPGIYILECKLMSGRHTQSKLLVK